MATSSRAPSAARRRVFHPSWLTVTFGLSSRHRNLRRSASRVGARPWLTATELAQCVRRPHWSTSAWFACPPFAAVVAPRALTTRSTRTPTGGAARLGGRRLPWFVRHPNSMSYTLIATIVIVALLIGVARLFARPKRPPSAKFKCARCGAVELHSERTENAWRGDTKRLFCDSCHRIWLAGQPNRSPAFAAASNKRPSASRGCLGVAILLAVFPFAAYWAYTYA
jgi:hypothetical protein